jgi:hypothetical protein
LDTDIIIKSNSSGKVNMDRPTRGVSIRSKISRTNAASPEVSWWYAKDDMQKVCPAVPETAD